MNNDCFTSGRAGGVGPWKRLWLLGVAAAALGFGCVSGGAGRPAAGCYRDLPYATLSKTQRLDLFLPPGDGPFPVVLNIHGGGFRFGDKGMLDPACRRAFLEAGYAVASVNYRLSGEACFPAAVQDVKAAVRFLRANAGTYRLDPRRMAAFGQSAGGNLAALLGTSAGEALFEDPALGNAGVDSRVQAVIDWFGPTDFAQMDAQARAQGGAAGKQRHDAPDSFESRYLGAPLPSVPDRVRQANPVTYVDRNDPPFLIQNGACDNMVPVAQSRLLAEALRAAGGDVQYDLFPDAGHGDHGSKTVFAAPENLARLIAFLNAKMRTESGR